MLKLFQRQIHPSWHFYALIWGIILGIVASLAFKIAFFDHFSWLIVAFLLFFTSIRFAHAFTLLLALISGLIFANFRTAPQLRSQEFFENAAKSTVVLSGTVSEDPDTSSGSTVIRLQNLQISNSDDSTTLSLAGTAYIQLSGPADVKRTDSITLKGTLGTGFGTFVVTMFRPEVVSIEKLDPPDPFVSFKDFFSNLLRSLIPSPEIDLGLGYLMGMKSGLSESFSEALRAVGMTHVIVASGAHLAILIGAAKQLFGRISKFAGLMFSLLLILVFVGVVGFTPSMTRAALVAGLSLLFGYVGRTFTPFRLISFVAALTLLIEPINFLNLGWQLSFASFCGILMLAPRLQRLFYGGKKPPWLASMLLTSLATCLLCAPILIYNFNSLSLLSFVANLIILPTLPYAMLLLLLTGATSFLSVLSIIFAKLATLLLDLHIFVVNFLSEKNVFILNFPEASWQVFLLYPTLIVIFLARPTLRLFRHHRKVPAATNPLIPSTNLAEICYNEENEDCI